MVERSELLGQGATCRVYSWGEEHVVKVFRRAFEYLAPIEVERVTAVHEAGAPTPAVQGIVSLEGRVGIVFDRIRGPSLLDELVARRLTRADAGQRTASRRSPTPHIPTNSSRSPLFELAAVDATG
jgi:hypothetical protein